MDCELAVSWCVHVSCTSGHTVESKKLLQILEKNLFVYFRSFGTLSFFCFCIFVFFSNFHFSKCFLMCIWTFFLFLFSFLNVFSSVTPVLGVSFLEDSVWFHHPFFSPFFSLFFWYTLFFARKAMFFWIVSVCFVFLTTNLCFLFVSPFKSREMFLCVFSFFLDFSSQKKWK